MRYICGCLYTYLKLLTCPAEWITYNIDLRKQTNFSFFPPQRETVFLCVLMVFMVMKTPTTARSVTQTV